MFKAVGNYEHYVVIEHDNAVEDHAQKRPLTSLEQLVDDK